MESSIQKTRREIRLMSEKTRRETQLTGQKTRREIHLMRVGVVPLAIRMRVDTSTFLDMFHVILSVG